MVGEPYIPPEVVTEILSRLEVKSLLVLKCVCKLWCSIVENQYFVEMHMKRSKVRYVKNLYENGADKDFEQLSTKNGLLLEKHMPTNKLRIRNPAIKLTIDLPDPLHKPQLSVLCRHLSTSGNYKVVSVFGEGDGFAGCQVLTLGIDQQWRILNIPSSHHLNGQEFFLLTDEVTYIMRFSHAHHGVARGIVCIEMETEGIETLRAPKDLFSCWDNTQAISWENKLSLSKTVGEELHVWVLEDYKTQKWSDSKIIISLSFMSKHSSISDKFYLDCFKRGWLYFYTRGVYYHKLCYQVKSGREYISDNDGESICMKVTLVNPYRVPPLLTQPAVLDRSHSICLPFIGILNLIGRLCFFPK